MPLLPWRSLRWTRALAVVACVLASWTCDQETAGLGRHASLAVAALLPPTDLAAFNLTIDNVRLIVVRPPADTVFDKVFSFPANQSSLPVSADVPLEQSPATFQVTIQLLSGATVLFEGTQDVTLTAGGTSTPTPIPVTYSGPGQNVATLTIDPIDSALSFGGSLTFRPTARDGQGNLVSSFYVSWTTSDTVVAAIDATGTLVAPAARRTVIVTAHTPNNVSASTPITFSPVANGISVVSGCGQSGAPGLPLPQPIVVRVVAGDGLGVKGIQVQFTAPAGGSVASPLVTTDDNGLAQTLATLPLSGPATFSIGAAGLTTLTCNQTILGATHLVFTTQPSSLVAGSAFAVAVKAADAQGATVTSFNGVVRLTLGANPGGISFGTSNVTAVAGIATIAGLSIQKAASGYTLVASASGLTSATTAAFDVIASTPSHLAFTVQPPPLTVTQGVPIVPTPVVVIEDAFGNIVLSATDNVTIGIGANPGGAVLGGTLIQSASSGVAAFPGLTLDQVGTGYTLTASSGNLAPAVSASFNVIAVTGLHLVFTTQPSNVTAGNFIAPAVVVTVLDGQNNTALAFTGDVILSLGSCGTGTLSGTKTMAAVAGIATFADLSVDRSGPCILVASSAGMQGLVSAGFTVAAGAAAHLGFTVQPSTVVAGAAISPVIQVAIQDALGNTVPTATDNVTLDIGTNPGNAVLGGTTTKPASGGVALFPGITLDKAGTGYTLVATSGTLTQATSAPFDVTGGAVTHYAVVVSPPAVTAGGSATIIVTAQDGLNNTVTGYTGAVTFTSSDVQATLPANYTFVAGDLGTHTFTNGATLKTQGGQTVTATDVGAPSVTGSGPVTVSAGSATTLAFTGQPGSIIAGTNFAPPVLVTAQDAFGNTVTTFVGTVSLGFGSNPGSATLLGTTAGTAAAGVASFASVSVDKVGAGYSLTAAASGLSPATSTAFNVTAGAATQLGFLVEPSSVVQGVSIAPAVQVAIQDQFGNTVTTRTDAVTLAIGTNPGSGTLGGTTSQAGSAGIATFNNLTVSAAGSGYTLDASATGLGSVGSTSFDVLSAAAGVAWNNPSGGNWSVPSNWTPARVPGKADTVFITLPGTYTVTLDVNDTVAFLTLGSATGAQTLTATGRTFGIDTAAAVLANGSFNLTGTTINGNGTLSALGTIAVSPGASAINGTVGVGVGGVLRLNGNNGFADLSIAGTLTNAGTVELMGTSWSGRLSVTGGNLQNAPTGTLHSAASAGNVYTGVLDNQGGVLVDGLLTVNGVSADHQNSGTIALGAGNLTLTQSGATPSFTTSGSVVVGPGRTLQVNGGAFNYANAAPGGLAGLGTVSLSSVTLGLTPDFTQDTLSFVLSGSTVNGTGTLHVAATRTLTITGTTLNVPLDNAGTVQATFGTNVLNGPVANQAGALLRLNGNNGFADVSVASGFTNAGAIQLTGTSWSGRLTIASGVLINGPTGVLQSVASAGNVFTGVLNNQGAVQVDGPLSLNAASANHVNSGTITLGLGNLTLSQSGTTPSVTTTGSVVVGSGRTLQVNGGTFNYSNASPGGLAGLGTVDLNGVTFFMNPGFTQDTLTLVLTNTIVNGPGILQVAPARTLTLTGATLNVALQNLGTVQATPGTNLLNGTVTNQGGARLRLNGNNGFADVTVATGFTNAGTIELTGTSWAGRLTVTSGPFVNGPTGTLQSVTGAGNVLTAPLDNRGAVLVDGPLTLNAASADHLNSGTITLGADNLTVNQSGVTPSFTTSGDVVVGAGRTWTVNSGAVNHTAGKIEGNGTLAFNGVTLGLGVSLVHDTLQVALNTVTVNGPGTLTVASGATMTLTNTTFNTAFINQGTVQAAPGVNTFNAALTNPAGALLRLNGNNGFADVTVASGFTNSGIIELTGTSWAGRLTVGSPTLATLVNAPGATLREIGGAGSVLTAQLNNQGAVLVNGPLTLNGLSADHLNSGTITLGSGDLTLSQTGATPSFTTTGSVIVGSGRVLQVNAGAFNYANTVPGGLAGLGTVTFGAATLTLTPNFTQDTLTLVPTSTVINGPGSLTVAVGRTLTLTGSTVNTTLNNFGTVQATPGTNLLNGPFANQGGAMLRLNGNNGFADVTVANGFTNDGTIELTGTSWAGRLTVTTGTLANSPSGGTLQTIAGAGNVYNGDFDNQGLVIVGGLLTMNGGGSTYSNSGTIRLTGADMNVLFSSGRPGMVNTGLIDVGTKTFKVSGPSTSFGNQGAGVMRGSGTFDLAGTSFITNATVTVGNAGGPISAGKLNIIGPYLQGPSPSVMNVKIGGDPAKPGVDYDQLNITGGGANLQGGVLNVTVGTTQKGSYVVIQLPVGQTIQGNFAQINFSSNCDLFSGPSGNQYLLTCQ